MAISKASLNFRGVDYFHRWSKGVQHEFTPRGQEDLQRWNDMITLVQYPQATSDAALAQLAQGLLARYQQGGAKVLHSQAVPAASGKPAEHFVSVYFGKPQFIEVVFARLLLRQGNGLAVIYSHREYGAQVGESIKTWLDGNGAAAERELLALAAIPPLPGSGLTLPATH